MPNYIYSTDDEDSSYESDDGTVYGPINTAQYKLSEYNPEKPVSNRSIQIQLTLDGLNYFLRAQNKNKIQSGFIAFQDITPHVEELKNALNDFNGFKALTAYSIKIIDIILKNGHGIKGYVATGTYSLVRRFESKKQSEAKDKKTKVVLKPIRCDYRESAKKYHFFESLYTKNKSFYLEDRDKKTYRLVLPDIDGTLYGDLPRIVDFKEQVKLFLATVRALKDCHAKKIICLDLNLYNIKYLAGRSYLIDGGFSNEAGEVIDTAFFRCETQEKITKRMMDYDYIAPECWHIDSAPVARESMDIYAMGKILMRILTPLSDELNPLVEACCKKDANERIKLDDLEVHLEDFLRFNNEYSFKGNSF